jgi:hypothetical protein
MRHSWPPKRCLLTAAALAALCSAASDLVATTQPASAPAADVAPLPTASATVSDLAFLAGVWHARSESGGFFEEHMSPPAAGVVIGMFRMISASGRTSVVELETFCDAGGSIDYRFRHFSTGLDAWEPPKEPVSLRLVERTERRWVWVDAAPELNRSTTPARVTWEFPEPDGWRVMVDVRRPEGERRIIDVTYRRVSPGAPAGLAGSPADASVAVPSAK